MNDAISGVRRARCRMSVKIVACPRAWRLNSLQNYLYCGGHLSRTPNYAEFLDPNQGTRSTSLGTWQACSCGVVALALAFTLGMALQGKL